VIFIIAVLGVGGYFVYSNVSKTQPTTNGQQESVTFVGKIQTGKGDDYSHVLLSEGKIIGLASQTVALDEYIGKQVSVTGQYSGTTLYADTVQVVK